MAFGFVVCLVTGWLLLEVAKLGPIGNPWWLRILGVTVFTAGFAGGVCAVLSMTRQHERALLVYLALLPALFVLWFLIFAE